jgi:hypothetical protein
VAEFRKDVAGVSNELAKSFRSVGMSEADIKEWHKDLGEDSSPQAMHGAIVEAIHMLDSRLDVIADSYNRGMALKTTKPAPELLSPTAQKIRAKLIGDEGSDTGSGSRPAPEPQAAPTAPTHSKDDIEAEMKRRGLIK